MRKNLENISGQGYVDESEKAPSKPAIHFFRVNKSAFRNSMGLAVLKFIYLFTGFTGLAGTLYITIKVIRSGSISNFNMVLVFGLACLAIAVMYAGMYGYISLVKDSRRRNVNTSHTSRGSKKGAA